MNNGNHNDDTPDLSEYSFTLPDVAFLANVPEQTVRNWMNRNVLQVGKKHFTGRWTFNLLDALQLRVLADLTVRMPLNPANLAGIAYAVGNAIRDDAVLSCDRDSRGRLTNQLDNKRPNTNIIVAFNDDGTLLAYRVDTKDVDRKYPPHFDDVANAPLRRAHIIVPATTTFNDLLYRMSDLRRLNARQEQEAMSSAPDD